MRAIVDKILWGALIIFFGPTVMIIASWNALPGDYLFGVKIALEKTALVFASPSYASTGGLQIKYTERRYAETKQLLASRQSIEGLPYLQQQIADTKKMIDNAPNKEAQVALAKQYITTLNTVSTDLEVQKQAVTANPQPLSINTNTSHQLNTQTTERTITVQPTVIPTATNTPTPRPTTTSTPIPTSFSSKPTATTTPTSIPTTTLRNNTTVPSVSAPTTTPSQTPTSTPTVTPNPTPPAKSREAGSGFAGQDLASPDTQKSQTAVAAPITTGQAVVALQINQTQQDVSRTIADLQAIVEKDDKEQGEKHEKLKKEEKDKKDEKDRKEKKGREDNSK